ncbi:hypothetical protein GN958_ATG22468 [Phytophthora infestans]|uniref:Uncharacterized protein n=1 Tax=Phytophthora infestans TaxID=4787 RepID=A0A8S9TJ67_PHYIN|nr:hypothetical protein GN958_ATG22468 [Phytophthora infestans]
MRDIPFSEVDNEMTRELDGNKSVLHVFSKSARAYIRVLIPLAEHVITDGLPDRVAIIFDGWQHNTTHYVAVFTVFMKDGKCFEVLLVFSPPLDNKS